MPEAVVRGVHINYEVIGKSGPWIALTPGSRRPYGELVDLSKAIAASGYRVLLHDRRNCGASDVAFDGSGSEHDVWADDLYELGKQLDAAADGCRRLVGWRAAGDPVRHPAPGWAARPAALARHGRTGSRRQAVRKLLRAIHQARRIRWHGSRSQFRAFCRMHHGTAGKPRAAQENRREAIHQGHDHLAREVPAIRHAADRRRHRSRLERDQVRRPAWWRATTSSIRRRRRARLPASSPTANCTRMSVEKRSDATLKKEWDRKEWRDAEPRLAQIFTAFLKRAEIK